MLKKMMVGPKDIDDKEQAIACISIRTKTREKTLSKSYPRFTLLNLLVATTVIAMGFGTWLMGRQVAYLNKQTNPLKRRIERLEYELGYPDVADPSRLHVNCSGSRNSGNYRYFQYRAHVPENCEAKIELALKGDADLQRKGCDKHSFAIPAGKHTVDFDVFRDVVGDGWGYNLTSLGGGGYSFAGPMPPWFTEDGTMLGIRQYALPPEGIKAGDSFDLLRKKTKREDGSVFELVLKISLTAIAEEKATASNTNEIPSVQ